VCPALVRRAKRQTGSLSAQQASTNASTCASNSRRSCYLTLADIADAALAHAAAEIRADHAQDLSAGIISSLGPRDDGPQGAKTMIAWSVGIVGVIVIGFVLYTAWTARQVEKRLPPRGRFIDIDGAHIHYLDEGTRTNPPDIGIDIVRLFSLHRNLPTFLLTSESTIGAGISASDWVAPKRTRPVFVRL
jgi:hypothetical protein